MSNRQEISTPTVETKSDEETTNVVTLEREKKTMMEEKVRARGPCERSGLRANVRYSSTSSARQNVVDKKQEDTNKAKEKNTNDASLDTQETETDVETESSAEGEEGNKLSPKLADEENVDNHNIHKEKTTIKKNPLKRSISKSAEVNDVSDETSPKKKSKILKVAKSVPLDDAPKVIEGHVVVDAETTPQSAS